MNGNYGEIWVPNAPGIAVVNQALAKSASKTIGGEIQLNKFWGTSNPSYWNKAQGEALLNEVRIQGVSGAPQIIPAVSGTNNKIDVASFPFYKDNGTVQSSTSATDLTVTRPATGKFNWNLAIVTLSSGVVTVVTGTDGDAYSDVFGAAGGPPLVATTAVIVGAVKLSSDVAAPITYADITYQFSTGALIQERSDFPNFTTLYMEGGILLNEALIAAHTGPVPRGVYASFFDQRALMMPLGDTEEWTLAMANTATEAKAQNDKAAQNRIGTPSYTGTMKRFFVRDTVLFANAAQRKSGFVRLYPNKNNTSQYYEAAVNFTGWNLGCAVDANMEETVNFSVDGLLEPRGM